MFNKIPSTVAAASLAVLIALAVSGTCLAADGDEPAVTWRLQGPAFSYHFTNVGAPAHGSETLDDGNNILPTSLTYLDSINGFGGSFSPTPGQTANSFCNSTTQAIGLQSTINWAPLSAQVLKTNLANCLSFFQKPYQVPKHAWDQHNWELGLERDKRYADHVERAFAGAVVDSYYKPGLYAGEAYEWTLASTQHFYVDAGGTALLWWRSVPDATGDIRRRVVPVVMPALSIEDKKLGVGVNLTFVPAIRLNGTQYAVDTLIMQITWAL